MPTADNRKLNNYLTVLNKIADPICLDIFLSQKAKVKTIKFSPAESITTEVTHFLVLTYHF